MIFLNVNWCLILGEKVYFLLSPGQIYGGVVYILGEEVVSTAFNSLRSIASGRKGNASP
jgi:hypothetical protein